MVPDLIMSILYVSTQQLPNYYPLVLCNSFLPPFNTAGFLYLGLWIITGLYNIDVGLMFLLAGLSGTKGQSQNKELVVHERDKKFLCLGWVVNFWNSMPKSTVGILVIIQYFWT